jgi:hypothetical protein
MDNIFAIFGFCFVVIFFTYTNQNKFTSHSEVPTVTPDQVHQAAQFLADCKFLEKHWAFERVKLYEGIEFNVVVPAYGESGVCARYLPNGSKDYIFLYPMSWHDDGCYEANPMLVLAHEMLHQLGLPPHYTPQSNWIEYMTQDPIEVAMRMCFEEAVDEGRRIAWDQPGIFDSTPNIQRDIFKPMEE